MFSREMNMIFGITVKTAQEYSYLGSKIAPSQLHKRRSRFWIHVPDLDLVILGAGSIA